MIIEVTSNIIIKEGISYLEISNKRNIENSGYLLSIHKYINDEENDDNSVNKFLQKIGLFSSQNNLTKLGENFKNTGELFINEHGKYDIKYIENDNFLCNKILSINVSQSRGNNKNDDNSSLQIFIHDYNEEEVPLELNNNEYKTIKINNINTLHVENTLERAIVLDITIKDDKIDAILDKKYNITHLLKVNEVDEFIDKYINTDYIIYNKDNKKLIIDKNQYYKLKDDEKKQMLCKLFSVANDKYRIVFNDIELEPNNECSREWLEYLLKNDITYFVDKNKFKEKVIYFYNICDKFNKEYSYQEFKKLFSKFDEHFWYLNAQIDVTKES